MDWIDIDGHTLPHLLGGHPAVDLCNTDTDGGEALSTYEDLVVWAAYASLIDPSLVAELTAEADRRRAQASHVLHEARQLRAAVRTTVLSPLSTPGYRAITDQAHRAYADAVLVPGAQPRWELGRELETPLYAAALAAVDLVTGYDLTSVRTCRRPGCGAMFLDPQGTRTWCDPQACGNPGTVRSHEAAAGRERAIA